MKFIDHNGVRWSESYFFKVTDDLASNLGEDPSQAKLDRLQARYEAIKRHADLDEVEAAHAPAEDPAPEIPAPAEKTSSKKRKSKK